jgi:hypothetical protein
MPTLYTMPGACSLSPNIAVAWLDAPVEIHNIPYGDQKKDLSRHQSAGTGAGATLRRRGRADRGDGAWLGATCC